MASEPDEEMRCVPPGAVLEPKPGMLGAAEPMIAVGGEEATVIPAPQEHIALFVQAGVRRDHGSVARLLIEICSPWASKILGQLIPPRKARTQPGGLAVPAPAPARAR
jgi:hypothetical protein